MLTRSRSQSTEVDVESSQSQGLASQSQCSSLGDSAPQEELLSQSKTKRGRALKRKQSTHVAQWICILPEDSEKKFHNSFISLKDPKTARLKRYLLKKCGNDGEIYEVMKVNDGPRSWFIDNTVQTDGSLHMCTPIDPLFLALPYLLSAAKLGKFTTMDAILEDHSTHSSRILEECIASNQWEHVTDIKELSNGMKVYRYSWEKTRSWLKAKVEALGSGLKEEGVYVGAGSMSSSLVKSSRQESTSKDDYFHYAYGVISDYLPSELADKLAEDYPSVLESSQAAVSLKRESDNSAEANGAPPTKKSRAATSGNEPLEDYTMLTSEASKPKQVTHLSSAQKALTKVDKTGMKAISSFFSPKN